MENRQIKELMVAMGRQGIKKLRVKNGDWEVEIEREGAEPVIIAPPVHHAEPKEAVKQTKSALAHDSKAPEGQKGTKAVNHEEVDGHFDFVTSPMVGVFYPAPSPEDPPFVELGQKVTPDTVVCIIEAMKVMNEVKAGVSGVLEEVMVERGHPVEFGTRLFKITPSS